MKRHELAVIRTKVDMYNQFTLLLNELYDRMFILQPQLYITVNQQPDKSPTVIKTQVVWNSQSAGKHVSFSKALRSYGDYEQKLRELCCIFIYALQDACKLGDSPFQELSYGVNYG